VLVCDAGQPRNAASLALHGFLTRDGIAPQELLRLGREELAEYGVEVRREVVAAARHVPSPDPRSCTPAFDVELESGVRLTCRKLLLTTGVRDVLPDIDGLLDLYGQSVHHCPYCDAWGHRDESLAAFGPGESAVGLAMSLRTWSPRVTACSHGEAISGQDRQRLSRNGIAWREEKVVRLRGSGGKLAAVEFSSGPPLACQSLFFQASQFQTSPLADMLGCERRDSHVETHGKQRTNIPGLFLAGDADGDVQFVIVAAAEGARAAVAINRELQDEDRGEAN
jgi:thioredoxin reductase